MKRLIGATFAVAMLAGCSEGEGSNRAVAEQAAEPTVIILQCDGTNVMTVLGQSESRPVRRTYQIDLAAKRIGIWNGEEGVFKTFDQFRGDGEGGEQVDINPELIHWRYQSANGTSGSQVTTTFDRVRGTVLTRSTITIPGLPSPEDVMTGTCVKVDAPSTETVF